MKLPTEVHITRAVGGDIEESLKDAEHALRVLARRTDVPPGAWRALEVVTFASEKLLVDAERVAQVLALRALPDPVEVEWRDLGSHARGFVGRAGLVALTATETGWAASMPGCCVSGDVGRMADAKREAAQMAAVLIAIDAVRGAAR